MSTVTIKMALNNTCPDISLTRTITPSVISNISSADFSQYATMRITYPNGVISDLSSLDSKNYVSPLDDNLLIETLLVGAYNIAYTTIPSLRSSQSQNFNWSVGDNFYDSGTIYKVNNAAVTIPSLSATNAAQITTYLANGYLTIIDSTQISSQYNATFTNGSTFTFWCNLLPCLIDKLNKFNKANLKVLQGRDLVDTDKINTITQLLYIYQFIQSNTLDPLNSSELQTINSFANFVNDKCSCPTC